jgi:cob(I)alamin adenosyltransferase
VKDYFQLTANDQKKYIENLLVDFAKYLQQQRTDDLKIVQSRLNNIEQNNDQFKQETEQILSSIITNGSVPNSAATPKKVSMY